MPGGASFDVPGRPPLSLGGFRTVVTTGLVVGQGDLNVSPGALSGGLWGRSGKALGRFTTGGRLVAAGCLPALANGVRLFDVVAGTLGTTGAALFIILQRAS